MVDGDTVAIHITRLQLNRDWAISTDTLSKHGLSCGGECVVKNIRRELVKLTTELQFRCFSTVTCRSACTQYEEQECLDGLH